MDRTVFSSTALGFVVAALVFAGMFWLLDTETVVTAVTQADLVLVALVGVTVLLWNLSWGVALWNVLRALDVDVPIRIAILVNAAGAFVNHVSPFGQAGGEPVTAYLLTRSAETEYEVNLASVASLDAIHVIPSLSFATIGVSYYATTTTIGPGLEVLFTSIVVLAICTPVVAIVLWRRRTSIERRVAALLTSLLRTVAPVVPRLSAPDDGAVAERVGGFVRALEVVAADRRRLVAAIGFSAGGWAIQAVGLWIAFLAVGAPIPLSLPFFVVPIGTMASVVPTPGGLGGIEVVNVTLITLLTGISGGTVAVAVTMHSVGGYLLTTAVGAAATTVLGVRY
ncbi:lysylphosphatidylglycerol synthase transmembrane domain-containing protein [Halomontanus rarus]|uniref:lysylphosphatidylglycerol synthase transmembrane domain-containing protein n=1 Tax=Halomontanus rarus TaxID=3034020 RepID=UPI001A98864A|nr:lysylphosphatidylglycerol synthase transmembrane domain-containing protein [Halovivax sp. TS33]